MPKAHPYIRLLTKELFTKPLHRRIQKTKHKVARTIHAPKHKVPKHRAPTAHHRAPTHHRARRTSTSRRLFRNLVSRPLKKHMLHARKARERGAGKRAFGPLPGQRTRKYTATTARARKSRTPKGYKKVTLHAAGARGLKKLKSLPKRQNPVTRAVKRATSGAMFAAKTAMVTTLQRAKASASMMVTHAVHVVANAATNVLKATVASVFRGKITAPAVMGDPHDISIEGADQAVNGVQEYGDQMLSEVAAACETARKLALAIAISLTPVGKTGVLRDSNQATVENNIITVTNTAPYADYVIYGTCRMAGRDFITPATETAQQWLEGQLQKIAQQGQGQESGGPGVGGTGGTEEAGAATEGTAGGMAEVGGSAEAAVGEVGTAVGEVGTAVGEASAAVGEAAVGAVEAVAETAAAVI